MPYTPEQTQQLIASSAQVGGVLGTQYTDPLRQQPNWAPGGPLADPSQAALYSSYWAGLQGHPLEQGGVPSLDSRTFNMINDGRNQQLQQAAQQDDVGWKAVARGIWQGTGGAFIEQAKNNPLQAAGELAVGIGLIAGAGALDAATGGLATPLLWTAFAVYAAPHILPGLVSSVQNEVYDPSDQHMTQLMINVGTAGLTFGSPVKAFRSIGAYRQMMGQDAARLAFSGGHGEAVQLLTKNKAGTEMPYLLPADRFQVIPQTVKELEQEMAQRQLAGTPLAEEGDLIERYRTALREHDLLADKISRTQVDLNAAGSHDAYMEQFQTGLQDLLAKEQVAAGELVPLQKEFAHRYGYTVARENPMQRLSREEWSSLNPAVAAKLDAQSRASWGLLHAAGEGHGWDGAPDGAMDTQFAANQAELMARQDAAGSLNHALRVLNTNVRESAKILGVKEARMDHVYAAIEGHRDPAEDLKLWNGLSTAEKALAERLHVSFGIMTNHAFKHGFMEVPLHRYVPRLVMHEDSALGRGVRATQRLQEGLVVGSATVKNRSWALDNPRTGQLSEWGAANESMEAEFSPEEGLGTISERLHQTHEPWLDFNRNEQARRANYQENLPLKALLQDTAQRNLGGKLTTVNQFLLERRRELGSKRTALGRLEQSLSGLRDGRKVAPSAEEQLGDLARQVREANDQVQYLRDTKGSIARKRNLAEPRQVLQESLVKAQADLRSARTAHQSFSKRIQDWQATKARYEREVAELPAKAAREAGLPELEKLMTMDRDRLRSISDLQPGGRYLMSGFDLPQLAFSRYLRQMNQVRFRQALRSIAFTPSDSTTDLAYGAGKGQTLAELRLSNKGEMPLVVSGDIRLGDRQAGDPHEALYGAGYEMVMPEVGRRGQLNYQPALFGRKDVFGQYRALAAQARDSSEMGSALIRSIYNVSVGAPKRIIMGSPAWHGKNVMGRAVAAFVNDPSLFGHAAFRVLRDRLHDPDKYYATKMEQWQDGGVPANRWNVQDHLNWLEQQMSGQRNFGTVMRTALGAVPHAHAELAESWFWKTVDDVGTAAYLVQRAKLETRSPWMTKQMSGAIAAEYANNVSGMVNPLYMSKLWRWGRGMVFFAPSWWSTFMRSVGMSLPGASGMSHLLAKSEKLQSVDPVKFHSMDIRQRKEMVRAHRSYFTSMMAAAMVSHDALNFLFSGHHVWDNQKGHEWDLEMDREYAPEVDKYGSAKHVHLHSMFFFSQMADLLNATGMGHDWGFLHEMNSETWKQANDGHRLAMVGDALGKGFRQTAASKTSTAVTAAVGGGMGVSPYGLLAQGEIQPIDRKEAMLGLLPGGFAAQRVMDQQRRAAQRATLLSANPEDPKPWQELAAQDAQVMGKAALEQGVGLPALYYTGDEPANGFHFLSEADTAKYLKERKQIQDTRKGLSASLLSGTLTPSEWRDQANMETQKYLQLLQDTYGDQERSTAASLFKSRTDLHQKYNLDDPSLSRAQKTALIGQYEEEWQQTLKQASPEARSIWWEATTAQWTDADYLYWLAGQMRQSVRAHVDGEGGKLIQQQEARVGGTGLPVDPAATEDLRRQYPQLWTYHQVMSDLGKHSLLGALAAAFYDPFANFAIFPDDQAAQVQAMAQAGVLKGGTQLARQSTVQRLAGAARGEAQLAAPEGGQLAQTPAGQQMGGQLSAEAARTILQSQADLSAGSTKRFPPQLIAELQRIAQGG